MTATTWFVEKREINDKKVIMYFRSDIRNRIVTLKIYCLNLKNALELSRLEAVYVSGEDFKPIIKTLLEGSNNRIERIRKIWNIPMEKILQEPITHEESVLELGTLLHNKKSTKIYPPRLINVKSRIYIYHCYLICFQGLL
jgi:hypothetical protein